MLILKLLDRRLTNSLLVCLFKEMLSIAGYNRLLYCFSRTHTSFETQYYAISSVKVRNRFKGLDLIDRVPDELWNEVRDIQPSIKARLVRAVSAADAPVQGHCFKMRRGSCFA